MEIAGSCGSPSGQPGESCPLLCSGTVWWPGSHKPRSPGLQGYILSATSPTSSHPSPPRNTHRGCSLMLGPVSFMTHNVLQRRCHHQLQMKSSDTPAAGQCSCGEPAGPQADAWNPHQTTAQACCPLSEPQGLPPLSSLPFFIPSCASI